MAHVVSTSGGIGGAEQIVVALVREGARRGWTQTVLKVGPPESDGGFDDNVAQFASLDVLAGTPWRLPVTRALAVRILRRHRPELVQATLPMAGLIVGSLVRKLDWGCTTVLSHQHGCHFVASGRRVAAMADRCAGARFDRVIACSDATAAFLRSAYRYSNDRLVTIRNGWAGQPAPRTPTAHPTVVCVARLRRQKDHPTLLRAFRRARLSVPEARLRVVGDGPEEAALRSLAAQLELGAAIEFLGSIDDVWSVLAEADVFVLSSHYEPLGIAALEAMAAGVPVVATAVGGLPEIVRGAGILVQPGDEDGLAEGMVTLLTQPAQRALLAARGRERAMENTVDRMVGNYFDAYEELVAAHG